MRRPGVPRMDYAWKLMSSPIGELRLVAYRDRLAAVLWKVEKPGRVVLGEMTEDQGHPTLLETEAQLNQYFAGERRTFDLNLRFTGTTFQEKVWAALLAIPYGETQTYAEIADGIGTRSAARAVGAANGRNPIAIITPCHRLVGSSGGGLCGFAGGLEAKEHLLSLECVAFRARKRTGRKVFVPASGYTPASWVSR